MTPPEWLVQFLKPWNDFYSHSKLAATIVISLHVGGLLLAGGLAIAADRSTLRALRIAANDRKQAMTELAAVHRWVITGLTIMIVSGLALFASDVETFFGSWLYWLKMALFVVLLINGLMMTRTEQSLVSDASEASPHWRSLRRNSITSLGLWFAVTVLGVAVANFS
jgi:uncharacterized membrane protein